MGQEVWSSLNKFLIKGSEKLTYSENWVCRHWGDGFIGRRLNKNIFKRLWVRVDWK